MNEELIAKAQQFYKLMHLQVEDHSKQTDSSKALQSLLNMLDLSLAGKTTVNKKIQNIDYAGLVSLLTTLHMKFIWVRNNIPPEYSVKDNTVSIMSDIVLGRHDNMPKGITLRNTRLRVKADIRLTFNVQLKICGFEYEYSRTPLEPTAKGCNSENAILPAFTMGTSASVQHGSVADDMRRQCHSRARST